MVKKWSIQQRQLLHGAVVNMHWTNKSSCCILWKPNTWVNSVSVDDITPLSTLMWISLQKMGPNVHNIIDAIFWLDCIPWRLFTYRFLHFFFFEWKTRPRTSTMLNYFCYCCTLLMPKALAFLWWQARPVFLRIKSNPPLAKCWNTMSLSSDRYYCSVTAAL